MSIHDREAAPLHAHLHDPEQAGEAGEAVHLAAASHVGAAAGQRQDVGELACPARCPQQDKVRGKAEARFAVDNPQMLGQVGHKDTEQDAAGLMLVGLVQGALAACQTYMLNTKLIQLTCASWRHLSPPRRNSSGAAIILSISLVA